MTFVWHDQVLDLLDHPYNSTASNERAVEVPAAHWFLQGRSGTGLEVGNVLSHYYDDLPRRWIVDLHEKAPGVSNIDVFDVEGTWDWIVSISTMEHVGWDHDRDPVAALEAIDHLRDCLTDHGVMFITVPIGYHHTLDLAIRDGWLEPLVEATYERRRNGTWAPGRPGTQAYDHEHGWANAVWIAELGKDRTPT